MPQTILASRQLTVLWTGISSIPTTIDGFGLSSDTPTWTGMHTFNVSDIRTTSTEQIVLSNSQAATSGVPVQYSGRLRLSGAAWKTSATAASQQVDFIQEVQAVSGATVIGKMVWSSQVNGAGYGQRLSIDSLGNMYLSLSASANCRLGIGMSAGAMERLDVITDGTGSSTRGIAFGYNSTNLGTTVYGRTGNSLYINNFLWASSTNLGVGLTTVTALVHIKAGTATAGTAPLKLTSGTNMTTPESGAFEFDGTSLYFTVGGVRKTVTLT